MAAPTVLGRIGFNIGCVLYFTRVKTSRESQNCGGRAQHFADFRAKSHAMSRQGVRQHIDSLVHKTSLRLYGARDHDLERCTLPQIPGGVKEPGGGDSAVVAGVPNQYRFAWAAIMCLYNGSYSDYTRWIALQTFAVPGEVRCIDDNSRR